MVYDPALFNTDPYYDDFSDEKKFLRLLFKPGFAVQARELTQLQTIIQSQLERFGNNIFYDGSMVYDGQISDSRVHYARIKSLTGTSDVSDFVNTVINATASGSQIKVIYADSGLSSSSLDTSGVLYFEYLNGISLTTGDLLTATGGLQATVFGLTGVTSSAVGSCVLVHVNEGIRYVDGFFVKNDEQNIALYTLTGATGSQYRNYSDPTVRVGFTVERSFVTSTDDETLNDPAFGSYNYAAPGSDRYKIDLPVAQYSFIPTSTAATDNFSRQDFIEFLRVVEGTTIKKEMYPDYSGIEDTLARRTFDESGNYTVRPFDLIIESGTGATLTAKLEAGKAYIFGHEFETQGATELSLAKARDTRVVSSEKLDRVVGSYLVTTIPSTANNFGTTFDTSTGPLVYLSSSTGSTAAFSQIGSAKIRNISYVSGNQYYVHLFDIGFSGSNTTENIKSIFRASNTGPGQQLFNIPTGTTASILKGNNNDLLYELNYSGLTSISALSLFYWPRKTVSFNAAGSGTVAIGTVYDHFIADISPGTFPQSSLTVISKDGVSLTGSLVITGAPEQLQLQLAVTGPTFGYVYYEAQSTDITDRRNKTLVSSLVSLTLGSDVTMQTDANGKKYLYLQNAYDEIAIQNITGNDGSGLTNMTNLFTLDTGQTDNYYDWAKIVAVNTSAATSYTGPYSITLTKYTHSGFGPLFVNSYPNYESIPSYTSPSTGKIYQLRDVIDFRPYKDSSGNLTGCDIPSDNVLSNVSYTHYLPRTDKIVLTRDKNFKVIHGVSSLSALPPADQSDSMTLYSVQLNPYTFSKDDCSIRYVENKRYTMRDIGKLENRIDTLEFYTTLSLLEQEAKSTPIYDDLGFDRPKLGILVDSFKGHNIGDVYDPYYACSIDFEKSELRPKFKKSNTTTESYLSINNTQVSSDYILFANVDSQTPAITQTVITNSTPVNNTGIFSYLGFMTLSPSTDSLYDNTNPVLVKVNVEGENDAWAAPCASGNGFGTEWNDWERNWEGKEIIENELSRTNKSTVSRSVDIFTSSSSSKIFNNSVPESIKRIKLNKYVNESIVPYIRSQTISISAKGLKPSTQMYVFFDGQNVSSYCSGTKITDSSGQFTSSFTVPSATFRTGQRLLRITDSPTNNLANTTTAADAIFYAKGFLQTRDDGIVSLLPPIIKRDSVKSESITINIFTRRNFQDGTALVGNLDPLVQTFLVDSNEYPNGLFATKVNVYFKSVETVTNEPIILEIRPLSNNYPHPSKIIPFSKVYVYPSSGNLNTGTSNPTTFTFSTPVYLPPGEYAICLSTNSPNYSVYTAKIGEYSLDDDTQRASKNALNGILFKPQNGGTYTYSETEDLSFVLYKAVFNTNNVYYETDLGSSDTYSTQLNVDYVKIVSEELIPTGTSLQYYSTGTNGLKDQEYVANKTLNYNNEATKQISAGSAASSTIKIILNSTEDVSPMVDLNRLHVDFISNMINSNTNTSDTGEGSPTPAGATAGTLSRYITKSVQLDDSVEASNVHVYLNAYKPIESTIQVWVRYLPYGIKTGISETSWNQLTQNNTVNSSNESDFVELQYSLPADVSRFGVFQIKIVFSSTDTFKSPRIRNMRAIIV